MSIKDNINYPLHRELVEMGILTSLSGPSVSGPFQIRSEAFVGDTSGGTKTLAETPLTNGVQLCLTLQTDGSNSNNTLTALALDTHFTLSGTTLTWITDQSANQVMIQYAY